MNQIGEYSLGILASLTEKRARVPILWFYEVGNGLLMAYRRKSNLDGTGGRFSFAVGSPSD